MHILQVLYGLLKALIIIFIFTETGGLFGLAVRLMQLFSENKR